MLREIKFRAWDKNKRKMIYGPTDDTPNPSWVLIMCEGYGIEPMQFTGLHDKNGKEIYESDLVGLRLHQYPGIQGDAYDWELGTIKWCEEKAGFYWYDANGDEWKVTDTESEVIGNLYENPELEV